MCRWSGQTQITKEGEPMPRPILPRPIEIPIGPSIAYVPLTQGLYALIDREDAERVGEFNWFSHCRNGNYYAATNMRNGDRQRTVSLHNYVLGIKWIDHKNWNTLDDRRSNLRQATFAENARNRPNRGLRKHKGVRPNGNKWVAVIFCGKPIYLGSFATEIEAALSYDKAARELHGAFSSPNFPGGVQCNQ
jgi:hypothetical protein